MEQLTESRIELSAPQAEDCAKAFDIAFTFVNVIEDDLKLIQHPFGALPQLSRWHRVLVGAVLQEIEDGEQRAAQLARQFWIEAAQADVVDEAKPELGRHLNGVRPAHVFVNTAIFFVVQGVKQALAIDDQGGLDMVRRHHVVALGLVQTKAADQEVPCHGLVLPEVGNIEATAWIGWWCRSKDHNVWIALAGDQKRQ